MTGTSADLTTTSIICFSELVAKPWKNGTGVTREVACHPPEAGLDNFAWRISLADVAHAGPFSQFNGVDRTLVLLAGGPMRLTDAVGVEYGLRGPLDVVHFPGESLIEAEVGNGPTRDFNLMVSRDCVRANLAVWQDGPFDTLGASTLLFFCALGTARIELDGGHEYLLGAYDTLRVDSPFASGRAQKNAAGAVLAIRLYNVSAGDQIQHDSDGLV